MAVIHRQESKPMKLVTTWLNRIDSREKLKSLSDHSLKDIGLTRREVQAEVIKPFWRA